MHSHAAPLSSMPGTSSVPCRGAALIVGAAVACTCRCTTGGSPAVAAVTLAAPLAGDA